MPAYSAISATITSAMPQNMRLAYTRSPVEVTHQPVPMNAKSPVNASRPATMNITTAAKVTIPGLRVTVLAPIEASAEAPMPPETGSLCCAIISPFLSRKLHRRLRRVDRPFHLPGVRPDLLLHLVLGALDRIFDRAFDRRLAHHYQGRLALVEHLADFPEVRVGHPAPEVADERTRSSTCQPADQDRRGEDQADRRADCQTRPATVLGRLLGLVDYLDLALFVLGEDGGVVGANEVLAVKIFEHLEIGLRVVHAIVFTSVYEHRVVTHRILSLLICFIGVFLRAPLRAQ